MSFLTTTGENANKSYYINNDGPNCVVQYVTLPKKPELTIPIPDDWRPLIYMPSNAPSPREFNSPTSDPDTSPDNSPYISPNPLPQWWSESPSLSKRSISNRSIVPKKASIDAALDSPRTPSVKDIWEGNQPFSSNLIPNSVLSDSDSEETPKASVAPRQNDVKKVLTNPSLDLLHAAQNWSDKQTEIESFDELQVATPLAQVGTPVTAWDPSWFNE